MTFYDRWTELAAEAWGDEPEPTQTEHDVALAIEHGIDALEGYLASRTVFDDGAGIVTEYDQGELQQAEWFLGLAWDSLAETAGVHSNAWAERASQGLT
jgi:hypothetical protein